MILNADQTPLNEFSLSISSTDYPNSTKSIKLIDEIIAPYLENEQQNLLMS